MKYIMPLTIEQIDKKIEEIENYYNQFHMCSYEYELKDKMYLGRLSKLKEKIEQRKGGYNEKIYR